jgi:hypothetical protein
MVQQVNYMDRFFEYLQRHFDVPRTEDLENSVWNIYAHMLRSSNQSDLTRRFKKRCAKVLLRDLYTGNMALDRDSHHNEYWNYLTKQNRRQER